MPWNIQDPALEAGSELVARTAVGTTPFVGILKYDSSGTLMLGEDAGDIQIGNDNSAAPGDHLKIAPAFDAVDIGGKTVRIGFVTNNGTSNSLIGAQIKPAQNADMANGVTGLEVSPRLNSGVNLTTTGGTIIGIHADAYLKGTVAETLGGDVRALNLEVVTDDSGTRTITGNVNHIRIRSAFSATTISGKFVPIRIEKAEVQTNSKQYDAVLDLPSTNAGIWHDDPTTEPSTAAGYIKVLVNGNARYIQLYSTAPTD